LFCAKNDDFQHPRNRKNTPKCERRHLARNNPGRIFKPEKYKTTDVSIWSEK
jgi:hypothetical protein